MFIVVLSCAWRSRSYANRSHLRRRVELVDLVAVKDKVVVIMRSPHYPNARRRSCGGGRVSCGEPLP
jgi:hypothetical protein